jgi:hypothetical protein
MNALDKKLCRTFKLASKSTGNPVKEQETKHQFGSLLDKVGDAEISDLLTRGFKIVNDAALKRDPPDTVPVLDMVGTLRNAGLVETSALLFALSLNAGATLDYEQMLRLSPNAASVEFWRKKNKTQKKEFQKILLADLRAAYESAGGDWLLKYGEPKELLPMLGLFLKRQPRPKYLQTAVEALTKRLARDIKGTLLTALIRAAGEPEEFKILVEIALQRLVFRTVIESLPRLVTRKDSLSNLEILIKEFTAAVVQAEGNNREFLSAGLARLATGILVSEKRGPKTDAVLVLIVGAARQLRNLTQEPDDKERTWVLDNLAVDNEMPLGRLQITEEGARHIAIAFQKAGEGFAAQDILALTARNLGLIQTGQKGERITFNPLRHEDTEGGRLPGDFVVIVETGWMHGETVVRRAKVKRSDK